MDRARRAHRAAGVADHRGGDRAPWVDPRTVRLGPAAPIIVGLLGFDLYGIGGAIYGIALTVIGFAALDAVGRIQGDDVTVDPTRA